MRQFVLVSSLLPEKKQGGDADSDSKPVTAAFSSSSSSSAAATAGAAASLSSVSASSSAALTPYEQSMLQAEAAAVLFVTLCISLSDSELWCEISLASAVLRGYGFIYGCTTPARPLVN